MGNCGPLYQYVATAEQHATTPGTRYVIAHRLATAGRIPQLETHADAVTYYCYCIRGSDTGCHLWWTHGKTGCGKHVGIDAGIEIAGDLSHP